MYAQPIHASAFAYAGLGCLLIGESGSGKSRVLAEALFHGAKLVADDRVTLERLKGQIIAANVLELRGVVELRGFGLIRHEEILDAHPMHLVVKLGEAPERLPKPETINFHGVELPLLCQPSPPQLSVPILLSYLEAMQEGRILPEDWHPKG